METTKIKLRIGNHEFEAEGPVEIVQAQFQLFKELISSAANITSAVKTQEEVKPLVNNDFSLGGPHISIEKVMHVSGRIVSLTALPASIEDAAMLIMLGQKDLRNNLAVTGQEIGDGLAQSGRQVPRVDRVMDKAINEQYVLKSGFKRSTRYRLTNQGLAKALAIAKDLVASLP
jgi:hypothetical protein